MSIVGDLPGPLVMPMWRLLVAVVELARAWSAEEPDEIRRAADNVEARTRDLVERARRLDS